MMDTILNLGLNDEVVVGLANKTGNERFAYDSYRRFVQMYSDVVMEMSKSDFEKIIDEMNPTVIMKATKNDVELKNIINAHVKDGVAVTRFMYWLKKNIGKQEITERSAAEKLESFRREQGGYLEASFEPISAFAEHGAIVHYSASEESDLILHEGKLLLTDTGGHYMEGSTDITRTVALGEVSQREKENRSSIALSSARTYYVGI